MVRRPFPFILYLGMFSFHPAKLKIGSFSPQSEITPTFYFKFLEIIVGGHAPSTMWYCLGHTHINLYKATILYLWRTFNFYKSLQPEKHRKLNQASPTTPNTIFNIRVACSRYNPSTVYSAHTSHPHLSISTCPHSTQRYLCCPKVATHWERASKPYVQTL
jgi:hypothetical protein